eukprot:12926443-Prorocentrum_lima.AAC.1
METMRRGMEFVIEQVDQLQQNLQVDHAHQHLLSKPPVHHQPPHAPGQEPRYDLGDEPTWSWPPGLARRSTTV